jgi:PadR family transcriptional regulator PadR
MCPQSQSKQTSPSADLRQPAPSAATGHLGGAEGASLVLLLGLTHSQSTGNDTFHWKVSSKVYEPFPKDLATGSYDLVVLHLLSQGPAYVYGIIRRISDRTKHVVRWREGTAYRVLHDLERRGLVRGEWQGPREGRQRRYYHLTSRGRRELQHRRRQWRDFRHTLDKLLE